jgi:hypothetical protein
MDVLVRRINGAPRIKNIVRSSYGKAEDSDSKGTDF